MTEGLARMSRLCGKPEFHQLKSLSRGVNGERRLLLVHRSNTTWDMKELSADDENKAHVLYAALKEQHKPCSVDEIREMISQDVLPGTLLSKLPNSQAVCESTC
jgi:hypothetical protein